LQSLSLKLRGTNESPTGNEPMRFLIAITLSLMVSGRSTSKVATEYFRIEGRRKNLVSYPEPSRSSLSATRFDRVFYDAINMLFSQYCIPICSPAEIRGRATGEGQLCVSKVGCSCFIKEPADI